MEKIQSIVTSSANGEWQVSAELDNGKVEFLFLFFSDEIQFGTDELVGMTVAQAHALHRKKDMDYLTRACVRIVASAVKNTVFEEDPRPVGAGGAERRVEPAFQAGRV